MTEEMLRRDVKAEVGSKHTTTDTAVAVNLTKAGSMATTIHSRHTINDAKAGSMATTIHSRHTINDTAVGANLTKAGSMATTIHSRHTINDTAVGANLTKIGSCATTMHSQHTTIESKIGTVGAKVGTQLALLKKYLAHGTTELTDDPTAYVETAGVCNSADAWALMVTKVITSVEAETKTIDSVFVDIGWKHKSIGGANVVYTKWVASSLASGTGIAASAPNLTGSVASPSDAMTIVHRSGPVKLAEMTTLPLKIALCGKASGVSNSIAASIMSDSLIDLAYTI